MLHTCRDFLVTLPLGLLGFTFLLLVTSLMRRPLLPVFEVLLRIVPGVFRFLRVGYGEV